MPGSKGPHVVQPAPGAAAAGYVCRTICDDPAAALPGLIGQLAAVQAQHKEASGSFADDAGRCREARSTATRIIKQAFMRLAGVERTRGCLRLSTSTVAELMRTSTHQQHTTASLEEALAEVLDDCPQGSSWQEIITTMERALIAYCAKETVYVRVGDVKPRHKLLPIHEDPSGELAQVAEMLTTSKRTLKALVEQRGIALAPLKAEETRLSAAVIDALRRTESAGAVGELPNGGRLSCSIRPRQAQVAKRPRTNATWIRRQLTAFGDSKESQMAHAPAIAAAVAELRGYLAQGMGLVKGSNPKGKAAAGDKISRPWLEPAGDIVLHTRLLRMTA